MMLFSELLASADIPHRRRGPDVSVSKVADDSRRCGDGACFVAIRGCDTDGRQYIGPALAGGAAAVVCDDESAIPSNVPCAVVESARATAAPLAQAMLGWPARKLIAAGVTGTNGKTTVAAMVHAILESSGKRCGLLGTIMYDSLTHRKDAPTTTPGPIELARLTAEMVHAGCTHLVMELSSHALEQDRAVAIDFDVGIFTNLTGDHLDYHGSMEAYLAAKKKLFDNLRPDATAVINADDEAADAISESCKAKIIRFGLSSGADLRAVINRTDAAQTSFTITRDGSRTPITTRLIGRHNVSNCLAAAAAAMALGVDIETIAGALSGMDRVRGRLEPVKTNAPYRIFVDYAHTDDALENVLKAIEAVRGSGEIVLVFGCGGDRDRTKRPRMAKVAQRYADEIVVTSDNPRGEDPRRIIDDILAGFDDDGRRKVRVEPDREKAIQLAVNQARDADVVLIAGKGHENYQIIATRRLPFNDVEVARRAVAARESNQ